MSDLVIKVNSVDANGAIVDYEVLSGTADFVGYEGYRSATIKFVNSAGNEIQPSPIVEEFQGTLQLNGSGSIIGVNITQSGKGYPTNTQAQISGGLEPAAASATVVNDQITSLNINNPGLGYRTVDTNFIFLYPDRDEEVALGTAVLEPVFDGTDLILTGINVINPGAGYPTNIGLYIKNKRVNAEATATVVAGKLSSVTLTVPGTGYHPSSTAIRFIDPSTGTIITPLQFPIVSPTIDSQGNLTNLTITRAGNGLPPTVEIRIVNQRPKVRAIATLNFNSQRGISSVTLTNPGSGYRSAVIELEIVDVTTIAPVTRYPAVYTPIINAQGSIVGANKISEGNGYPAGTRVQITDNFSAGQVTPTVGPDGDITGFTINSAGSGYLNPILQLVDTSGNTSVAQPFILRAVATGRFDGEMLTAIEILESGAGYPVDARALVVDETQESCPEGVQSQNLWPNILGPDLYALAVESLTPQDSLFTRQEPVYDYCGRLVGYQEVVVTGDRNFDGGNPLDGATLDPLDLNHTFVWIDGTDEDPDRLGWGVEGYESEQLVGAPGSKKLTKALDLGPTITLYRGQSHLLSLPPAKDQIANGVPVVRGQEFYIYEVREEAGKLVPDVTKRFSQGLHRFETGEFLDDANGRNEDALTWESAGNIGEEPETWKRQDLFPNGTTLLFQIGEGDSTVGINHWPDYLAYSNENGTKFGLFKLV